MKKLKSSQDENIMRNRDLKYNRSWGTYVYFNIGGSNHLVWYTSLLS